MATYVLLRLASFISTQVPDKWMHKLFVWIGGLLFWFSRKSRRAVMENLSLALPKASKAELRRVAQAIFRNGALNYYDLLHSTSHSIAKGNLLAFGQDNYLQAQKMGLGVIIATAHLGSINLFLKLGALQSWDALILVEELRPKVVNEFFNSRRSAPGMTSKAVGYEGLKAALRCLKNGGTVVIACDRAIQGTGARVPFMGRETLLPVGVVELALRTGAPIVPAFGVRSGAAGAEVYFEPPILVDGKPKDAFRQESLLRIVGSMERYIRKYPEQWVVFSPIWASR